MLIHQSIESSFRKEKARRVMFIGDKSQFTDVPYQELPKELLEPVMWAILNPETMAKVIGKVSYDDNDFKNIMAYLFDQKKYDLFVAMLFHKQFEEWDLYSLICEQREKGSKKQIASALETERKARRIKLRGQWHSFIKWCDEKERLVLQASEPWNEIMRLAYLAFVVGYDTLGWEILLKRDVRDAAKDGNTINRFHVRNEILYKTWVHTFYAKQPDGKQKKKLAKKIVQHGPEIARYPIQWDE